ncbi:MAG TPA: hypothetical protein PK573_00330 [Spirochaetota bacterium]|nr:hypothetical protein [Spirochaetota bacterium]HRZ25511.1 hypothetical protein [Spirochaetota bacterium]
MKRLSDKFYSRLFFLGALWNFTFSLAGLVLPAFSMRLTFGPDMDQNLVLGNYYSRSMYLFWWASVLLFGIGYYIVSRDINKNRGIVWMAVIGKLAFFFFFTYSFFTDRSTLLSFLGGSGDFGFTILFLIFLLQTRKEA